MKRVFVDTSFYLAIGNSGDSLHERSIHVATQLKCRRVTTDFVLIEIGNMLCKVDDRPSFLALANRLRSDMNTTIVCATRELVLEDYALYSRFSDKNWSYTDCISFALMRSEGITEALTADHHYEQAGFKALLLQA